MSETTTNDDAQYAHDIVKTICTEVGPGWPGSLQERERAAIILGQDTTLAGDVLMEGSVSP